jgi:hypothetical protein
MGSLFAATLLTLVATAAHANDCGKLPGHNQLEAALKAATLEKNGGLGPNM